jgi:hypothetical protein
VRIAAGIGCIGLLAPVWLPADLCARLTESGDRAAGDAPGADRVPSHGLGMRPPHCEYGSVGGCRGLTGLHERRTDTP